MILDSANDPVFKKLSRLPAATPDASRSERVRASCHAVLARRRRKDARWRHGASQTTRVLEAALVGGFCLCYVSAVILDALLTQGIL